MKLKMEKGGIAQLYAAGSPGEKELLEKIFDRSELTVKVTDRIKTLQDACNALGISPAFDVALPSGMSRDADSIVAYMQLIAITRALNEGWEPDWTDTNQLKYTVYLGDYRAGSGFSGTFCDYWITGTTVGSRLCFKSRELALYAAEQFKDIYNRFFIINP